jgi:hypothetical protein
MKEVVVILSKEAQLVYDNLAKTSSKKENSILLRSVNKKSDFIKANVHYGRPIAKSKIPRRFMELYSISNLFWVSLPFGWRMLYSLTNNDSSVYIVAFVVHLSDHKQYEKVFGY